MTLAASRHDSDFYAWANEQAGLLHAGTLTHADIENIADGIESMGKSEKRERISRLTGPMVHLLNWHFPPEKRTRRWGLTLKEHRRHVADVLDDNPSVRSHLLEATAKAYGTATIVAERETGLRESTFSPVCPWSYDQMVDGRFWPAG
jgi:hypothetical protein